MESNAFDKSKKIPIVVSFLYTTLVILLVILYRVSKKTKTKQNKKQKQKKNKQTNKKKNPQSLDGGYILRTKEILKK